MQFKKIEFAKTKWLNLFSIRCLRKPAEKNTSDNDLSGFLFPFPAVASKFVTFDCMKMYDTDTKLYYACKQKQSVGYLKTMPCLRTAGER